MRRAMVLLLGTAAGLLWLAACDSGEKRLTEVDPNAVPLTPDFTMVQRIVDRACVPCHGGDGAGSPGNPNLKTCEAIVENFGNLLRTVNEESMPPGAWPRLTEPEKQILRNWFIETGAECP